MPLPEGIQCRTRPRKDGSKYTKCYGGADTPKKTNNKKKSTSNISMPTIDNEIDDLMRISNRQTRRKQSAPKKNAKTIPQSIARKELVRGRSYQADRARQQLLGKPVADAPKAGKVALKRNVRAKAKGDIRTSKAPSGTGGKVEALVRLADEKKPTGDYSFKKDDPQVFITPKEDIITGTAGKGMKSGGRFKVKAIATRGGKNPVRYIVLRPENRSMTMGNIASSNKFGELLMSMAKFKEEKSKMNIT